MYAVIKTGGKQYSVKVGDVVYVEKLNAEDISKKFTAGSRKWPSAETYYTIF